MTISIFITTKEIWIYLTENENKQNEENNSREKIKFNRDVELMKKTKFNDAGHEKKCNNLNKNLNWKPHQ